MKLTSAYVTLRGTRIHYVVCGRGKPIVLVHGLTNNWLGHIPLATGLAKKYQVFMPDLPGYGDSGQLARYDLDTMATYLHLFIKELGIRPVAVGGLSMGGVVAAEYGRLYPKATRSIVIMGPVLGDTGGKVNVSKHFFTLISFLRGRKVLKKIIQTRTIGYAFSKYLNMHRFNKKLVDLYGTVGRRKMNHNTYVEMAMSVADYNLDKTVKAIKIPALLLYGREDKYSSYIYARNAVIPYNQKLSLAVIPHAGHVVSLEKSHASAIAIHKFLTTVAHT